MTTRERVASSRMERRTSPPRAPDAARGARPWRRGVRSELLPKLANGALVFLFAPDADVAGETIRGCPDPLSDRATP